MIIIIFIPIFVPIFNIGHLNIYIRKLLLFIYFYVPLKMT